ncbi:MAG: insulinase family protein [Eubacterium sp.]|nr:insulinase family protein [Eubacterium sp.]
MNIPGTYELVEERHLPDINADGILLRHKKSGARVFLVSNDDDNKVFSIAFRTPPINSTGLTHILEHSVLCGSREFPVKDPFVELAKGSMNTFLNAMTYPDKTVYPIASTNDKDFKNLMHVYMDAVFYPNIYDKEEIFRQEGWHYEMESADSPVVINGVVYNEMKGAFSAPESVLEREVLNSLYPDTPYGFESGGDPVEIPKLSYETFLDFHRTYYHPANSYIYLYGDMDFEERLAWMDEHYLGDFDSIDPGTGIPMQKPFDKVVEVNKKYSVTENDKVEDNTYLSLNFALPDALDRELVMAFYILEYALLSAPGAVLKQALLDSGIGKDVLSSYDSGVRQPLLSIVVKNSNVSDKEKFLSIVEDTLNKVVEEGIDKRMLQAAINISEFRYRESDTGRYPVGLMRGLSVLESWLYDDTDPFCHLMESEVFSIMKEKVNTGYFEELVKKYFIDNPHRSVVIIEPERGLTARGEAELAAELEKYKASLSSEEIEGIVEATRHLREYQSEPSTQEELETIPLLSLSDMRREAEPIMNRVEKSGDTEILYHDYDSKGIAYLNFVFDAGGFSMEEKVYLSLLQEILGVVDTENYSYKELSSEINIHTGGIGTGFSIGVAVDDNRKVYSKFKITAKCLVEKLPKTFELVEEVICRSRLDDKKRIKEIIDELRSRLQMANSSAGHSLASLRGSGYFSPSAYMIDRTSGIAYYDFISDLADHFDEKFEAFRNEEKRIIAKAFTSSNLMVDVTCKGIDEGKLSGLIEKMKESLHKGAPSEGKAANDEFVPEKMNEGFKTASKVNYVARCGNFRDHGLEYTGSLRVLKVILNYGYLWNNLRVMGGAYGCMSGFDRSGDSYFVSYRDPHIAETEDVYEKIPEYLRSFEIEERDLVKNIIGVFSTLDTPLSPNGKGARSRGAYWTGLTTEMIQKGRDEVLNTTVDDIRALADYMEAVLSDDCRCVIGAEQAVEENKDRYTNIRTLQ